MSVESLELQATFDYMFISDPPIFADIGTGIIGFHGLSFSTNITTEYVDSIEVTI